MSVRTEAIGAPVAAVTADASLAWRRAALWGLLGAKVVSSWGVQWDIQWHTLIGRDSFWIAPHLMTYAGVVVMVGLSFGVLAATTLSPSWRGGDVVRVLGLTGTRGFHLAAWGIALTVLAAPIDDLWHRLFGLDVTLWSPPHLLGLLGAMINTLGCFRIARESYPATNRVALAAVVCTGTILYIGLHSARQNRTPPGALASLAQLLGLLPVAALVLVDPRRRPIRAAVAYALVLFALMAMRLASLPAFRPLVPDAGATLVALGLTLVAGVVGGWMASRTAAALDPAPRFATS